MGAASSATSTCPVAGSGGSDSISSGTMVGFPKVFICNAFIVTSIAPLDDIV